MTSTPFSHALNFLSVLQGGVDPRTGLFTFHFTPGTLHGGLLQGPSLPLTVRYMPACTADAFRLGTGVTLPVTVYTPRAGGAGHLALSTGEQYMTGDSRDGSRILLRQYRPETVKIYRIKAVLLVVHKSGIREWLAACGDRYVTVRMESPVGHALMFEWRWNSPGGELQPERIFTGRPGQEQTLCRFTRTETGVTLSLWPDSTEQAQTNWTLTQETHGGRKYLTHIRQDSPAREWTLSYDWHPEVSLAGCAPLCGLTAPGGYTERVQYTPRMKLNDWHGGPAWPAAARHSVSAGGGTPEQVTDWVYSDSNWLGYGAAFRAPSASDDNLYSVAGDYTYFSVEQRRGNGGEIQETVHRTWNNYHLLTETVTDRGTLKHTEKTGYGLQEGVPLVQQPACFALPLRRTQIWQEGQAARTEVTQFTYDDDGNPLTVTMPDGTVTMTTWYPAAGETEPERGDVLCPPSPAGFVRFMRERRVIPPSTYGDEPEHITVYRYRALEATLLADTEGAVSTAAVVQDTVLHYTRRPDQTQVTPYLSESPEYTEDTASAFFGHPAGHLQVWPGPDSRSSTDIRRVRHSRDGEWLTATTEVDVPRTPGEDDGERLVISTTRTHSVLTGWLQAQTDARGNGVRYAYDGAGRLTRRIQHPDIPERCTEICQDWVDGEDNLQVTVTDMDNSRHRTTTDGSGRVLEEAVCTGDDGEAWSVLRTCAYDATGLRCKETHSDSQVRDGKSETVNTTLTRREFTDEGQLCRETTVNEAVTHRERVSMVRLTTLSCLSVATGREADALPSGSTEVTTDISGRPVRFARHDAKGERYSAVTQKRDGAGRVRVLTDAAGCRTRYEYDEYGRMSTVTLPDDAVQKYGYAPFTTAPLTTAISLTPAGEAESVLGNRHFDGLARLTESHCGGRTLTQKWASAAETYPHTVTGLDTVTGTHYMTVITDVDPMLNDAITAVSAGDTVQGFTYDLKSGRLLTASEGDTALTRTYRPSGRLKTETVQIRQSASEAVTSAWTWTPGGQVQTLTGPDGTEKRVTRATCGAQAGLTSEITEGTLTAVANYDALNRPAGWLVSDGQGVKLHTEILKRDDFGREEGRRLTGDSGDVVEIWQTWNASDQRTGRRRLHARPGQVLQLMCEETFSYDCRGRLKTTTAKGEALPYVREGQYRSQTFTYDALNNIRTCETAFADGGQDTAAYHYEYAADPCRLTRVTHTLTGKYPGERVLTYDAAGRLENNGRGAVNAYDALGRLLSLQDDGGHELSRYGYDAHDRLVWQTLPVTGETQRLYHREGILSGVHTTQGDGPAHRINYVRAGGGIIAQCGDDPVLTGADSAGSVVVTRDKSGNRETGYSAWGYRPAGEGEAGYNGERTDPVSGISLPGNGYRGYDPALMRFDRPDDWSPFGAGGLNPYAYCAGDPVNHADPSGHVDWGAVAGIAAGVIGVIIGIGSVIVSGGTSIPAAISVLAALTSVSLSGLSLGMEHSNQETDRSLSTTVGWIAAGIGIIDIGVGGYAMLSARLAAKTARAAAASTEFEFRAFREANSANETRDGYLFSEYEKNSSGSSRPTGSSHPTGSSRATDSSRPTGSSHPTGSSRPTHFPDSREPIYSHLEKYPEIRKILLNKDSPTSPYGNLKRSAVRKIMLSIHPDKVDDSVKKEAKNAFQIFSAWYPK